MIFVIRVICGDYIFGKNTKKGDWCHYLGPNSFFHYVSSRNLDRPLGWIWSSLHMRANYASTIDKWNPRIWSWFLNMLSHELISLVSQNENLITRIFPNVWDLSFSFVKRNIFVPNWHNEIPSTSYFRSYLFVTFECK